MSGIKRRPGVPMSARLLAENVSKADLVEAAWDLASLLNDAGSVDDDESTFEQLVATIDALRDARGQRRLSSEIVNDARNAGKP